MINKLQAENLGLYQSNFEHDACGVGFIAQIEGKKSHDIVLMGLDILKNIDHRGAVGADPLMGDGAGVILQIPDNLFRAELNEMELQLPPHGEYGVGMMFLPQEKASRIACERIITRVVESEGQKVVGWRDVPTDKEMPISPRVIEKKPVIRQIFVSKGPDTLLQDSFERKLFVIRKQSCAEIKNLTSNVVESFTFHLFLVGQLFIKDCYYLAKLVNSTWIFKIKSLFLL